MDMARIAIYSRLKKPSHWCNIKYGVTAGYTAVNMARQRQFSSKSHRRFSSSTTLSKTNDFVDKLSSTNMAQATRRWLESIVIAQKLCPFAAPVRNPPKMRIHVVHGTNHQELVDAVAFEIHNLVGDEKLSNLPNRPETTLVVLNPQTCPSLKDFRDLIHLSWIVQEEVIVEHNYTSLVQQVLFHPEATHETYALPGMDVDAADYTIRSPYPTIHLLREQDVMQAVASGYPDLEGLPARNKAKLRQEGAEACRQRLLQCTQIVEESKS